MARDAPSAQRVHRLARPECTAVIGARQESLSRLSPATPVASERRRVAIGTMVARHDVFSTGRKI